MHVVYSVDELPRDPDTLTGLTDAALQHVAHPQLAPYLATPLRVLGRELRMMRAAALLCQEYEYPRFDACVALGRVLGVRVVATFQGGDAPRLYVRQYGIISQDASQTCRSFGGHHTCRCSVVGEEEPGQGSMKHGHTSRGRGILHASDNRLQQGQSLLQAVLESNRTALPKP